MLILAMTSCANNSVVPLAGLPGFVIVLIFNDIVVVSIGVAVVTKDIVVVFNSHVFFSFPGCSCCQKRCCVQSSCL